MIQDVYLDHSTWADLPHKFEAGTPAIGEAIAMGEAISYLKDLGFEKKHNPFLRIDELSFLDYLKDENLFTKEDIIKRFKLLRVLRDEW